MGILDGWRIELADVQSPALPPIAEVPLAPDPPVEDPHPAFPFQNLAFEGGGIKGLSYVGGVAALEARGIYPRHVRRVAGTSSGSLMALAVALGMPSDEIVGIMTRTDLGTLLQDAPFWPVGPAYNMLSVYGLNPGRRLLAFLGELVEERTGSRNATFQQVLDRCGRELCVPICNLSHMAAEFCHPKTTPDMPVRLAVGISMALPVLMRPYRLMKDIGHGAGLREEDLYVDGGLLCNYPLHVFDGWYLSLDPNDSFLQRLRPLRAAERILQGRFSPRSEATLGFTVFDRNEHDATRSWAHAPAPARPDSPLARRADAQDARQAKLQETSLRLEAAVERFFDLLGTLDANGSGCIDRDELEGLFREGGLSKDDALLLFDDTDVHAIFDRLDHNGDGRIVFSELQRFMDAKNVDLTARAGHRTTELGSVGSFFGALINTMLMHIRSLGLRHEDRWRTVAIDTDYIGTSDFGLVEDDRAFLIETGRRATEGFLDAWLAHHADR